MVHGTRSRRRRQEQEELQDVPEAPPPPPVLSVVDPVVIGPDDVLQPQDPVVVATSDGVATTVTLGDLTAPGGVDSVVTDMAAAVATTHLVVHDASGNPVLVQAHPVAVQEEEVVTVGVGGAVGAVGSVVDPTGQVTVLEVTDASAEAMVGIVAGLEEAADQLLEQEKHVEAARATENLLNHDPSLKKDGPGISDLIVAQHREKERPRFPPVPDRTEEYGVNKPLPEMSRPLKQIYTCSDCGEMYQGYEFFSRHLKEEHGKDLEEDVEEKEWKPNFVIHAGRGRTPPPDYREFECPKCDFIASKQEHIDEHLVNEHRPKDRVACHECGKDFARKWELQVHVKTAHLGIRDHQCPQCDYRSADKGRVQKHLKMVHWKVRDYHCDQCDYKGSSTSALKNHVKAIHLKLKEFKCQYCDHTAVQKGQITSHMNTVHLNIKPYHCNQCEFRAADNGTLKKHIRVKHDKIRDHICQHCGYGSSSAKQLEAHIEKKHINPKRRKLKPIPMVGIRLKTDWTPPAKPRGGKPGMVVRRN